MSAARAIYLHALTPVHSGTGQTVAVIDLPIAREKATGYPFLPASSFKGVLKSKLSPGSEETLMEQAFGAPGDKAKGKTERAGAISFNDQRILCLPVRSYFGTFAYVTCPLTLQRLDRDFTALGITLPFTAPIPPADMLNILLPESSVLEQQGTVYLEDLDLKSVASSGVGEIAQGIAVNLFAKPEEQETFKQRFALVSNDVFSFLCDTAVEITARVVLNDDTKTTKNLWYEEAVPAEAIFYGAALFQTFKETNQAAIEGLLTSATGTMIQIGGNASVGNGLCRVVVK